MCDCERPSCYTKTTPRARKRHQCCECRGWIDVGEQYQYISGIWDGSGSSYKTCPQCAALRDRIQALTKCCVGLGGMREDLRDLDEYHGHTEQQREMWAEHNAIRIRRGAAISPAYKEEENELAEVAL